MAARSVAEPEAPSLPASSAGAKRSALLFELITQELRSANAGSVLGLAWMVIQPLLVLATYWFLLTVLGARTFGPGDDVAQLAYLFGGLIPWLLMARGMTGACSALTRHAGLVKNVNFPQEVLPFATVGAYAIDYVVGLATLLCIAAAAGLLGPHLLVLLPVSLLALSLLAALAVTLGPVAVMFRDLPRLLAHAMRAGLFLTPVLYLPAQVPDGFEWVVQFNPLAYLVGLIRYATTGLETALVHGLVPDLVITAGITLVTTLATLPMRRFAQRQALDHL